MPYYGIISYFCLIVVQRYECCAVVLNRIMPHRAKSCSNPYEDLVPSNLYPVKFVKKAESCFFWKPNLVPKWPEIGIVSVNPLAFQECSSSSGYTHPCQHAKILLVTIGFQLIPEHQWWLSANVGQPGVDWISQRMQPTTGSLENQITLLTKCNCAGKSCGSLQELREGVKISVSY